VYCNTLTPRFRWQTTLWPFPRSLTSMQNGVWLCKATVRMEALLAPSHHISCMPHYNIAIHVGIHIDKTYYVQLHPWTEWVNEWVSEGVGTLVECESVSAGAAEQVQLIRWLTNQCLLYGTKKPADAISEVLNSPHFTQIIACFTASPLTYFNASTIVPDQCWSAPADAGASECVFQSFHTISLVIIPQWGSHSHQTLCSAFLMTCTITQVVMNALITSLTMCVNFT